jgi:hypothetical protein
MCQQWFSVVGLVMDICGFLLIAKEWWHVFQHSIALRQSAVEADFDLATKGVKAARKRVAADASMWRNTQFENEKDNSFRRSTFIVGAALVILGFIGQLIGSWPYGSSMFGFASCS